MIEFRVFHPLACRRYQIIGADDRKMILSINTESITDMIQFCARWDAELRQCCNGLITPQLLAALALAASGGNPHYEKFLGQQAAAFDGVPHAFFDGPRRVVYAVYGLFAIPLPVARVLLRAPQLDARELVKPTRNFELTALRIADFITRFRAESIADPDPLQIALFSHGSSFAQVSNNKWRIHYRGCFLDDFISWYNTYPFTQPQGTNHEQADPRPTPLRDGEHNGQTAQTDRQSA